MIDDLSRTLRAILTQKGLSTELAAAQILFDHPSETFNPQQTTVDLFLYDIREDLELRSNQEVIERKNGQVIAHRPPLRVACSYLVTAWPVGGTDVALQEQRLLSQVLQVFSQLPTIPASFLQDSLRGQSPPLPMVTALVDPQKNLSEFWTALGSRLRPSLTLTATIAIDLIPPQIDTMVSSERLLFGQRTQPPLEEVLPGTEEDMLRIGGQVTDEKDVPVSKASVTLVELGLETGTDDDGHFILNKVKSGDFTLRVKKANARREIRIKVPAPERGTYNVQLKR